MKKLILTLLVASGFLSASAGGYCRIGKADLTSISPGTYRLNCNGDYGVCYETDNNGCTSPGCKLLIHYNGGTFEATIMSGSASNLPPNNGPTKPSSQLPTQLTVKPN